MVAPPRRPQAASFSMTWSRVAKSGQAVAAHASLLCFTVLLVLKLDFPWHRSWWLIFTPLWIFHIIVARGRFSLPAPVPPHDRHWAPCHAVVAIPLLVAFEILLCTYLDSEFGYGEPLINLKLVFLPLIVFEGLVLIDNFRMCRALMPSDEESMTDEAIWETLPHFWVAVSMVFFIAATVFTLLKLNGDVSSLGWWDLFINYGIAECFAFLVCTKWFNPAIHHEHQFSVASTSIPRQDTPDDRSDGICGLQDIGGHIMKIPLVIFQVLLCMHLEGTPMAARNIPIAVIFIPIFLVQGVAVLLSILRLLEKIIIILRSGTNSGSIFSTITVCRVCFGFLHRGSRLLGWWSIDESSREEQARLLHAQSSGYNTFCAFPPEIVKKMAKKELAEEIWRLQAALGEQTEITKYSQQEYERLQNASDTLLVSAFAFFLCCHFFLGFILLHREPYHHHPAFQWYSYTVGFHSTCAEKCKKCPICRVPIMERMPVYDV